MQRLVQQLQNSLCNNFLTKVTKRIFSTLCDDWTQQPSGGDSGLFKVSRNCLHKMTLTSLRIEIVGEE